MERKILIVHAEDELTQELQEQFTARGFDVTQVPDSMLGMKWAIRLRPDVIIADLHCPAGGGVSLLQNLRLSLFTRNIPVLILTASVDAATKKKLLDYRILTYFQKPFETAELIAAVEEMFAPRANVVESGDYRSAPSSPSVPLAEPIDPDRPK